MLKDAICNQGYFKGKTLILLSMYLYSSVMIALLATLIIIHKYRILVDL